MECEYIISGIVYDDFRIFVPVKVYFRIKFRVTFLLVITLLVISLLRGVAYYCEGA